MEIFNMKDVTFSYSDVNDETGAGYLAPVISHVDLTVQQGDFLLLMGPSGSGKSTLLRCLKPALCLGGKKSGEILFCGNKLDEIDEETLAKEVGFVLQDVDAQLVTDKVWHELAFGLESLYYSDEQINKRVAEMCTFFGLSDIFHSKVTELSGGQKQLVNLASVMALDPKVIILDEPTSQLDPIGANEFISHLVKINRELGTTIIITEHRSEELMPVCNKVAILKDGELLGVAAPNQLALKNSEGENVGCLGNMVRHYLPSAAMIYLGLKGSGDMPLSVAQGHKWLEEFDKEYIENKKCNNEEIQDNDRINRSNTKETDKILIKIRDISYAYSKKEKQVLKGLDLDINENEILSINGGNGSGKSTLLSLMAGVNKVDRGSIKIEKGLRVALLPQDPKLLFTEKTVREELAYVEGERREAIVAFAMMEELMDRHPYDLSGGEQQRLGLAKVLMCDPDIILMDEPTKGLDNLYKRELVRYIRALKNQGKTIVIVSHDIEFCAEVSDRAALLFDGRISAIDEVNKFFSDNRFYTTAAAKISRGILESAITVSEVLAAYGVNEQNFDDDEKRPGSKGKSEEKHEDDLSFRDKTAHTIFYFLGAVLVATMGITFYITMKQSDLTLLVGENGITKMGYKYMSVYGVFICAAVFLFALMKYVSHDEKIEMKRKIKGNPYRYISFMVMLLVIPLTIWFGIRILNDRKYYFISLLIIVEAMVPFFLSYEKKNVKVREIVTLAVICGLAVAGRAAFFMLPNFNPVIAIVIISGVAYGAEFGFMTGAITMLASNMIFGQGPWTPWQMFTMGLIGFISGIFFYGSSVRRKLLTKMGLVIFGAIMAIVIFGGIMNLATVLMYQSNVNSKMILAAYITGFPFDVIQACATVLFLWFMARPFLEQIDRVKIKYGDVR